MKYIRTNEGVYEIERYYGPRDYYWVKQDCEQPIVSEEIISQADTIEELCDEFIAIYNGKPHFHHLDRAIQYADDNQVYGAIWTAKGLIYVAKMNEKGELELL